MTPLLLFLQHSCHPFHVPEEELPALSRDIFDYWIAQKSPCVCMRWAKALLLTLMRLCTLIEGSCNSGHHCLLWTFQTKNGLVFAYPRQPPSSWNIGYFSLGPHILFRCCTCMLSLPLHNHALGDVSPSSWWWWRPPAPMSYWQIIKNFRPDPLLLVNITWTIRDLTTPLYSPFPCQKVNGSTQQWELVVHCSFLRLIHIFICKQHLYGEEKKYPLFKNRGCVTGIINRLR